MYTQPPRARQEGERAGSAPLLPVPVPVLKPAGSLLHALAPLLAARLRLGEDALTIWNSLDVTPLLM